jgi:hypothetical protein
MPNIEVDAAAGEGQRLLEPGAKRGEITYAAVT